MTAPLVGYVDLCDREQFAGWAVDLATPDTPVRIQVRVNGELVDETDADGFRADLQGAARGGYCAFQKTWPVPLPHEGALIELTDARDDRPLAGSPVRIPPLPASLMGSIDLADRYHIAGWVRDQLNPDRTVWLTVWVDGQPAGRVPANRFRADLRDAGFGTGRHGFHYAFSSAIAPLTDHVIELRHGDERFGTPCTISGTGNVLSAELKTHVSSILHGLDTPVARAGALAFLVSEADRLRARESADLTALHERAQARRMQRLRLEDSDALADVASLRPVALFIDDRAPDPQRDAGSVAFLSHVHTAQSLGYRCCFMASRFPPGEEDRLRLEQQGIECLMPPVFTCPEEALRQLGAGLEVVYLHRLNNAESYSALVRAFAPTATMIWSVADLTSLRLPRQAAVESRPELERFASRLEVRENMCAWLADFVLTHSPVEAGRLSRTVPTANVHVAPWTVPVFPRKGRSPDTPVIAFVGHFAHDPNLDAAKWLVLTIMSLLREAVPGIRCRLIGSAMPHAVHMLAAEDVEIMGAVPDLEEALADVSLCVAPLRFGAGIKGKVLEAWAVGLPIVMTPIAAEGLVDPADPIWRNSIADTPSTFAERIIAFLDPATGQEQVTAGQNLLKTRFSERAVFNALSPLFPPVPQEMDDIGPMVLN
ncbi:glycosyltransferase [Gluconobacter sp. LMG 31484]|uniref:Glycosyltransferase n=1 Tax=Gluconobacter vitians TaxID=2728102 RepID=A0ABR9Y5E6_9PROT|nr:glycosyltransferase [Gluconobacter vitians]MBF0859144.1 glycosyltransferase [Gluconobacter vitians]